MSPPGHATGSLPPIRTQAGRSCVMDSGDPSAQGSVATQAGTPSSSGHDLEAARVSALMAAEKITVYTMSVLLAAFFLIVGASKLSDPSGIADGLSRWSSAKLLYLLARTAEMAGAAMLLIPRWASLGAVGLAAMMAGIIVRHLTADQSPAAILPSVLVVLLGIIAYARRPKQR